MGIVEIGFNDLIFKVLLLEGINEIIGVEDEVIIVYNE